MIASSGSTTNPYRYGGKYGYYTEAYTGLILATQRWYSPNMMRWISRDPIGFDGGVNLYEYVGGRPTNFYDVQGTRVNKTTRPNLIIDNNDFPESGLCKFNSGLCKNRKQSLPNYLKSFGECGAEYSMDLSRCSCLPPYAKQACLDQARLKFEMCKQTAMIGSIN